MAVEEAAVVAEVACLVAEEEVAAAEVEVVEEEAAEVAVRWMKKCKYGFKIDSLLIVCHMGVDRDVSTAYCWSSSGDEDRYVQDHDA